MCYLKFSRPETPGLKKTTVLILVFIACLLVAPSATAYCGWRLLNQEITTSCSTYDDGQTWHCSEDVTNYWEYVCGGGGDGGDPSGGGGNSPGGGGNPCPSRISVSISSVNASAIGRNAFIIGTTDSDGTVVVSVSGPGADLSGVSGPVFSLPVNLDAVPVGSNGYMVTATASGPSGCPAISSSAMAVMNRTSAIAQASDSAGFFTIPVGEAFLVGSATIGGYDAFDKVTASPAGSNFPILWTKNSVAIIAVSPHDSETTISDATVWHTIAGLAYTAMSPMQGAYLPPDDSWHKTYAASQQLWVSQPPVQSNSGIDRIVFDVSGIAASPLPQPNAAAMLQ